MSHRTALAWSVCFGCVAAVVLAAELGLWTLDAFVVWPALLIVLGLVLLIAGLTGTHRRR